MTEKNTRAAESYPVSREEMLEEAARLIRIAEAALCRADWLTRAVERTVGSAEAGN